MTPIERLEMRRHEEMMARSPRELFGSDFDGKVVKKCAACGDLFRVSRLGVNRMTCSELCKEKVRQPIHRSQGLVVRCLHCNAEVTMKPSGPAKRYCNDACRARAAYRRKLEKAAP